MAAYGRKDEPGQKRRRLFPDARLRFAPPVAEKDESEVRWLISYSDFMMQLVCLFILLYSVSSIDTTKAVPLAQAWRDEMGLGEVRVPDSSLKGPLPLTSVDVPRILRETALVKSRFAEGDAIRLQPTAEGFLMRLRAEMFDAGSSRLNAAGERIVDVAALLLQPFQASLGSIEIAGHASSEEPESLRLSGARAEEVLRRVTRFEGPSRLDTGRMRISARGAQDPVSDATSTAARGLNRRVEFLVRMR